MDNSEFSYRTQRFIDYLELVLNYDWTHTTGCISDESFVSQHDGTFLDPFPGSCYLGGKGDNWANRSAFLEAYRNFKALAIAEGLYDEERRGY